MNYEVGDEYPYNMQLSELVPKDGELVVRDDGELIFVREANDNFGSAVYVSVTYNTIYTEGEADDIAVRYPYANEVFTLRGKERA